MTWGAVFTGKWSDVTGRWNVGVHHVTGTRGEDHGVVIQPAGTANVGISSSHLQRSCPTLCLRSTRTYCRDNKCPDVHLLDRGRNSTEDIEEEFIGAESYAPWAVEPSGSTHSLGMNLLAGTHKVGNSVRSGSTHRLDLEAPCAAGIVHNVVEGAESNTTGRALLHRTARRASSTCSRASGTSDVYSGVWTGQRNPMSCICSGDVEKV